MKEVVNNDLKTRMQRMMINLHRKCDKDGQRTSVDSGAEPLPIPKELN